MAKRHLARQRVLQLLYSLEYSGLTPELGEKEFLSVNAKRRKGWDAFATRLTRRTFELRESLDAEIEPALDRWKLERLSLMDRLCLRMALCEFREFPDIPLRVTLNEYIELGRMFGTDESPRYLNGVLDRLAKDYRHKDFGRDAEEEIKLETPVESMNTNPPAAASAAIPKPES